MEIKNVQDLRAAYPELAAEIANEATAAERKRIQDIEGIALPGFEGVINGAKFENPTTAADVAMKIVAEQRKHGTAYLENRDADVKDSGASEVTGGAHEGGNEETDPYDAIINRVLPENKGGQ